MFISKILQHGRKVMPMPMPMCQYSFNRILICIIFQHGTKTYGNADVPVVIEGNVYLEHFREWKGNNADADVPIVIQQNVHLEDFREWKNNNANLDVPIFIQQNVHLEDFREWKKIMLTPMCQ